MQSELVSLEAKLERQDARDAVQDPNILGSADLDDSQGEPRRKYLLKEIDDKLKSYG